MVKGNKSVINIFFAITKFKIMVHQNFTNADGSDEPNLLEQMFFTDRQDSDDDQQPLVAPQDQPQE